MTSEFMSLFGIGILNIFPTARSGDGGDEIESTWPYLNLMQFLNDDVTPEFVTGNLHVRNPSTSLIKMSNLTSLT